MQNFRHAVVVPVSRTFGFVVDGQWIVGGKNDERVRAKVVGVIPSYCGESGGKEDFLYLPDFIKERTVILCDPLAKRSLFILDAPKQDRNERTGSSVESLRLYRAAFVGTGRPTPEELFGDLVDRRPLLSFVEPQPNRTILACLNVDSSCELVALPKREVIVTKPKPKLVYTPLGFRFR